MSLVTIPVAADRVGKSNVTIYRYIHSGRLTAQKASSGQLLVDTDDLDEVFAPKPVVPRRHGRAVVDDLERAAEAAALAAPAISPERRERLRALLTGVLDEAGAA